MTYYFHRRARRRGDNTADATGIDRTARFLALGRRIAAFTLIAAALGACGDDGAGSADDSGSPAPLPSGQATTTTPPESADATDVADGQPPEVESGATSAHAVHFEQAPLGGTLRFVAFADDFATEVRFDVAVPA